MASTHGRLVADQFGPNAQAYVKSLDHRSGADLDHLARIAASRTAPGWRVLDVGCGGGHVSFTLVPFAEEVVALDLSGEMLAAVRLEANERGFANVRTEDGVAARLPFGDGSFDLVATRFSAHHWPDLAAGLAEMRRVLRPDGVAVFMDTISPGAPILLDTFLQTVELVRDPSHVRDHSQAEWLCALRKAGFRYCPPVTARLRLAFDPWVARLRTPEPQVHAIRALQQRMPEEVRAYFAIEADGSFTIDTVLIEAQPDLA